MRTLKNRFGKDEGGFTLPELLVTIMMMIMVLFALYSIFDMGIRVFAFGNSKVEAVENARIGLEKMGREIRAAYPVDSENDETHLFFNTSNPSDEEMPYPSQITFGNELDGDGKLDCPNPAGACEYITYRLDGTTLMRNITSSGTTLTSGDQPVITYVNPAGANGGLNFTYLGSNGDPCSSTNPKCGADAPSDIDRVRITLDVRVQGGQQAGTQTLTTDVDLRNQNITPLPDEPPPPDPDTDPECSDGEDNDGDGKTDHPNDPGCDSSSDDSESPDPQPQCSDGIDNDNDGKTDFKAGPDGNPKPDSDKGCLSATDNDEADPPDAKNDSFEVKKNQTLSIGAPGVLSNDAPSAAALTVVSFTQPVATDPPDKKGQPGGTVNLNLNGSGTYTAPNFTGKVKFTYTVSDSRGETDTAEVTIEVKP